MASDPRYMISIKGKLYLKYEGALQEAHTRGLRELLVDLIQVPTPENGNVAISRATAILEPATPGGPERRFTEYGDAAPNNTAPMVANALMRMAATRAKGRALRDAIGVGEALAEEIYDAGDHPSPHVPAASAPSAGPQRGSFHVALNEPVAPTQAPVPAPYSTEDVREGFCGSCGIELTDGQRKLSQTRFGKALCPKHQALQQ